MGKRLLPENACPSEKGDNEMRELIENVSLLQKQLNELQLENQLLKNILDRSGISYARELKRLRNSEAEKEYDPNQGARIVHPEVITLLLKKWRMSSILGSGEGRMCTPKDLSIKAVTPDIILSVITS